MQRLCYCLLMGLLCLATAACSSGDQSEPELSAQEEMQLGQEVYDQLNSQGVMIEDSPLYSELRPISEAITRVAQPQYFNPFKFYLVHDKHPNAFATPGGFVFVTDSLLAFAHNADELAGTLSHEVAHTIHHDTVAVMVEQERIRRRQIGAAILLGPTRAHLLAIALIGKLHSLGYSRDVEERADLTGADICANTGYNPWGLVWLFQDFANAEIGEAPELLSDHPDNNRRIQALEAHFRNNPTTFARFSPNPQSARKLSASD